MLLTQCEILEWPLSFVFEVVGKFHLPFQLESSTSLSLLSLLFHHFFLPVVNTDCNKCFVTLDVV